jgi:hypothetical protein
VRIDEHDAPVADLGATRIVQVRLQHTRGARVV